jgi:hypothetical protein
VPTLVRPLDTYQPSRAAEAVASAVRGGVISSSRHEETVHLLVEFRNAPPGLDKQEVADLVTAQLKRTVDVRKKGGATRL